MRTPWWNTRSGRAAGVFAATFTALVVAGAVAMRGTDPLAFARQDVPHVPIGDPIWYPVQAATNTNLDHLILWHGLGTMIENARRADVLFVGNSTTQFALPPGELRRFERRTGLSAFSIALPFAEAYRFPLALIEKFDLRPRVVVVNVAGFFKEFESPEGRRVRRESVWAARRTVWEERLATLVWPSASRVLPSFFAQRSRSALLRSSEDGTWKTIRWKTGHLPVSTSRPRLQWSTQAAQRFTSALRKQNVQVVLTCVPSSIQSCSPFALAPLATALGVPLVAPRIRQPLWTTDMAHLSQLSGKRFGRALLRDLAALPEVRAVRRKAPVRLTAR